MNVIIAHGYAHRLLNSNVVESAPVKVDTSKRAETIVDSAKFMQRTPESMDLSGGDAEFIRMLLQQLSYVFASDEVRLPHANPVTESAVDPMGVK